MLVSDAQKTFMRSYRPGLITTGMFAYTRNPNYLGEILVYLSFALLASHELVYGFLAIVWGVLFMSLMMNKDLSLARKPGWAEYSN
jgi:steroid 5-alpha reductase family enzyme